MAVTVLLSLLLFVGKEKFFFGNGGSHDGIGQIEEIGEVGEVAVIPDVERGT